MSTSTTLTLTRFWITDATNPTVAVTCGTRRTSASTDAQDGQVRQYTNGRAQGVVTPTSLVSLPIVLVGLSKAQLVQLNAWQAAGSTVLVRSAQGERFYATFFELDSTPVMRSTLNGGLHYDVSTTFYSVTYTEGV